MTKKIRALLTEKFATMTDEELAGLAGTSGRVEGEQ